MSYPILTRQLSFILLHSKISEFSFCFAFCTFSSYFTFYDSMTLINTLFWSRLRCKYSVKKAAWHVTISNWCLSEIKKGHSAGATYGCHSNGSIRRKKGSSSEGAISIPAWKVMAACLCVRWKSRDNWGGGQAIFQRRKSDLKPWKDKPLKDEAIMFTTS